MLSVRIKPDLEARLVERAKRERVTKSKLVNDILARELVPAAGPYTLLQRIRKGASGEARDASERVGAKLKAKLKAEHARAQRPR